jgi:hypothetical protein
MIKKLKEIIIANHSESMISQKEILLTELDKWKWNSFQTDDILVLGIRF